MFTVISGSLNLGENCFVIRRCRTMYVDGDSRANQRFTGIKYMLQNGEFATYDDTMGKLNEFKNKSAAASAFRKYYPKEKFFLIEHLDDPK